MGPNGPHICHIVSSSSPVSWGKNAGKLLDVMTINSLPHLTLRMTLRITLRHAFCVSSSWSCTSGRWRDWRISLDSWRFFPESNRQVLGWSSNSWFTQPERIRPAGKCPEEMNFNSQLILLCISHMLHVGKTAQPVPFFCGMSLPFTRLLFICVIVDDRL